MHIQARSKPQRSPANLAEFLEVIGAPNADGDRINVEGVTGSALEHGGHFCFTVEHGRARETHDRLTESRYTVEWTRDVYAEKVPPDSNVASPLAPAEEPDPNQPGVLAGMIQRAKDSPLAAGRTVHEVMIGAFTGQPGTFFVQVTFQGADWSSDRPTDEDDEPDEDD